MNRFHSIGQCISFIAFLVEHFSIDHHLGKIILYADGIIEHVHECGKFLCASKEAEFELEQFVKGLGIVN
jgi:hypothetical protein